MRLLHTLLLAGLLPAAPLRGTPAQAPARRPQPVPAPAAPAPAAPAPALDSARLRQLLYWPTDRFWQSRAPDSALVDIETTRGTITVLLRRAWAPNGVDRAYNLARAGYFNDSRVYRVVDGFVAQFGLAGDPGVAGTWSRVTLPADARKASNVRGTVSFAQYSPNDRTTNLFINLRDNSRLDALGFAPVGRVVKGMAVADRLYAGYGERPMAAANTQRAYAEGNKFFDAKYPKLDRIRKATVRAR